MRAIIQVVRSAKVTINGALCGECGTGFLIYLAIHKDDDELACQMMVDRISKLRILPDHAGKLNWSLNEVEPSEKAKILLISNFTVYGNPWNGRRPSYQDSASFELGQKLYLLVGNQLRSQGITVSEGEFGADMEIESVAIGPVNLIIDTKR